MCISAKFLLLIYLKRNLWCFSLLVDIQTTVQWTLNSGLLDLLQHLQRWSKSTFPQSSKEKTSSSFGQIWGFISGFIHRYKPKKPYLSSKISYIFPFFATVLPHNKNRREINKHDVILEQRSSNKTWVGRKNPLKYKAYLLLNACTPIMKPKLTRARRYGESNNLTGIEKKKKKKSQRVRRQTTRHYLY